MKATRARIFAELRFGGAAYFAWARLPAAYPAAMKLTGVAVLTRFAVDRRATIYLAIGVISGCGLTLIIWPLPARRKGPGT